MEAEVRTPSGRRHALDGTPLGATAKVRWIVFEGLRDECARRGVTEGQLVRVEERTSSSLVVGSPCGIRATLERSWARFIEVETEFAISS